MLLQVSVILFTGGGGVIPACLVGLQAHTLGKVEGSGLGGGLLAHTQGEVGVRPGGGVSRPTPRGEVEGSGLGDSRPTPGGISRSILGVSQHALRQIPSSGQLLLWAVRILLECILVEVCCHQSIECWHPIYCETPFEFLVFN